MTSVRSIYDKKLETGDLHPDADQARGVELLAALQQAIEHPPKKRLGKKTVPPKGLYFYGGVGRGKSMVMDLFFNTVKTDKKRRVHFHAFMLEVHDYMHAHRADATGTDGLLISCAKHIAKTACVLCFDEFQVKDVADAMILGRLFSALFDMGVVCIMTSNIAPENLYEDGLNRDRFLPFIALLREKMDIVHFTGETDYRMARIAGRKIHFWPHDADAAAQLDKIFMTLSEGDAGSSMDITVKGRVIHVPRAYKETCALTFAEICGTAKSALDYLELCKYFRVFIVSDIPKMNDDKRDQALRFMTLVDTLYEHRAILALSADTPVDKIYTGDMHKTVFQRTVSRLHEMASKDYGR